MYYRHLTVGCFNPNSVYNREESIQSTMEQYKISLMFLTEPMLRNNVDTAVTLPSIVKVDIIHIGRRGLMCIVHPSWTHLVTIPDFCNPDCTYIQWVKIDTEMGDLYIANVYLPNRHYDNDQVIVIETVKMLTDTVNSLPPNSMILIVGDLNADMHTVVRTKRGVNYPYVKQLLSQTHGVNPLSVVPRPTPQSYTRPSAGSHPDGMLASEATKQLIQSDVIYITDPIPRSGSLHGGEQKLSDHIPIVLQLNVLRKQRTKNAKHIVKWNTALLEHDGGQKYANDLALLSARYMQWLTDVIDQCSRLEFTPNHNIAELLYEGLLYMLFQAAYTAIGTVIKFPPTPSPFLPKSMDIKATDSDVRMWKKVNAKLAYRSRKKPNAIPILELEAKERKLFSRTPQTTSREVNKFILRQLDLLTNACIPGRDDEKTRIQCISDLTSKGIELKKKLKKVAAGLDQCPMELLKYAPTAYFECTGVFAYECRAFCMSPLAMLIGLQNYIPKKPRPAPHVDVKIQTDPHQIAPSQVIVAKPRFRGLRRSSIVGKLLEKLITDPILPISGRTPLICRENFAGVKGIGADMATWLLSRLIDFRGNLPLLLLCSDVDGAYDNVWRDALWAKLASKHKNIYDVKLLRTLYRRMISRIQDGDYLSEVIDASIGLPQGGPNSGKLFSIFLSDLPDELKKASLEIGSEIFGIFIICIIFMDDVIIPAFTPEALLEAMTALTAYEGKWFTKFSREKSSVLCLNVPNPPKMWIFGEQTIRSAPEFEFLSVTYTDDKKWHAHFKRKMAKAKTAFNMVNGAGVIGGSNIDSDSMLIISSKILPVLHSGCTATDISKGYKSLRGELRKCYLTWIRTALNLSTRSPSVSTFGEVGWIGIDSGNDLSEMDLLDIQLFRRMLNAPHDSLPQQIITKLLRSDPNLSPYMTRITGLLHQTNIHWVSLLAPINKSHKRYAKTQFRAAAFRQWHANVAASSNHNIVYGSYTELKCHTYHKLPAFRGRTLLTKLRVNDLLLSGAGYNSANPEPCPLCTLDFETRQHFIVTCPNLAQVRVRHHNILPILLEAEILSETAILQHILLVRSSDNVAKSAVNAGNLLADLWYERWLQLSAITVVPYHSYYP